MTVYLSYPTPPPISVLFWFRVLKLDFMYFYSAFRILLESDEDRLLVVFNRGLILMTEVNALLCFTVDLFQFNVLTKTFFVYI